jgi:hypothetical protein
MEDFFAFARAVAVAQPFHQPAAEMLKIHRRRENLKRIAALAQPLKVVRETKKPRLPHAQPPSVRTSESQHREIR